MSSTHTTPITWYQRPRPAHAPHGFDARLAEAKQLLRDAARHTPVVFANSLSAEDMVLFHLIDEMGLPIHSFALDTGKLPAATLALWQHVESIYASRIERVSPSPTDVAELQSINADSSIYESTEIRARCCELRKTAPLRAVLRGKRAWVTGLRRAQSHGRAQVAASEFDSTFQLQKLNPFFSWADEDVWYFIDKHQIPVSALYERGYASIGCDPCTRPIRSHEHPRAGRWWWEHADGRRTNSECGIHVAATETIQDLT